MKFNEILSNIIVENYDNKKILKILLKKWFGENPTDQEKDFGELLAIEFSKNKDKFNETKAEIRTFLNRYPNFNKNNLKNILEYDLAQIIFIISEFVNISTDTKTGSEIPDIFIGKNLPPTNERINASKDLWFSKTNNLIIDEDGFRVYRIRNRKDAQMWGYYNGFLVSNEPFSSLRGYQQWCISRHVDDSNLYGSYRNRRTFYFVIDESKNPEIQPNIDISQYYISALQTAGDSTTGFKITTILNTGLDRDINEQELYQIYPKLRGHFDKIKRVEYTQDELGTIVDELDRVDENENNEYAFWKVNTALKKRYIDAVKPITNPKSWETMNPNLKKAYFDLTDRTNYLERFSNFNILNHIKNNNQDKRSLIARLEKLGLRLGDISDKLMESQFTNIRVSIDNPNISIYKSKRDGKVGIFDSLNGDWLVMDGKTYDNKYEDLIKQGDGDIYFDETTGEVFIVEPFCAGARNNSESDDCFYVVYPQDNPKDGHILSNRKFMELQNQLTPEDEMAQNRSSQPKDYADIKEKWGL